MALDDQQKGFYDSRRYFQGKDNPDVPPPPAGAAGSGIPRSQLVAGMLFLALIAIGFFYLAIPPKIEVTPAPAATTTTAPGSAAAPPAPAAPAAH